MGRWKPPPEKSSPYITREGAESLRALLQDLWKLRRTDVVPALSAAAAEGDRSENAEYLYRKKQLAGIDRKIRYLTKRLDEIQVVDRAPHRADRVYFGAWVTLADEAGTEVEYRIVGADETSTTSGFISIDSPLARSLLGRGESDEVTVQLPTGTRVFSVVRIRYHSP